MKLYTRLIVDQATGEPIAAAAQDLPFADGYNPIEYPQPTTFFDFEIDSSDPLRAREIWENFEIINGEPSLKATAPADLAGRCQSIGKCKDISETAIKGEIADNIRASLAAGGESEADLIKQLAANGRVVKSLEELPAAALLRMEKALTP